MRSDFKGHCQACGRLQLLPKGVLSLHGYSVTHGFFSGVCVGAKHQPFELSCELIKDFIVDATEELARLIEFQCDLRDPATEAKAWARVYVANPRGSWISRDRLWKLVTVTEKVIPYRDGTGHRSEFWRDGDTKWNVDRTGIESYQTEVSAEFHATLLEVCAKMNQTYADWLEHEAVSLRHYITWQNRRVETWTKQPLLPVSAPDDKQGFKPTESPY